MAQITQFKLIAERLQIILDHTIAYKAQMEDLFFRAQRISNALKNDQPIRDTSFPWDFQAFRKLVRVLSVDAFELPIMIGKLERDSRPEPGVVKPAQNLLRQVSALQKVMRDLQMQAQQAYHYIRQTESRTESWGMNQDIEKMSEKIEVLPGHAAAIVRKVSEGIQLGDAPTPDAPPGGPAPNP